MNCCKMNIYNQTARNMKDFEPYIHDFYHFAKKKLDFQQDPSVFFISDPENAENPLGRTAHYEPSSKKISIYVDQRHFKDILRSISHEIVHHAQNCRGEFDTSIKGEDSLSAGKGYAQQNPHLRQMEIEAYQLGSGIYFRDWEDHLKENRRIGKMVLKEWQEKENINLETEEQGVFAPSHYCAHHVQDNLTEEKGYVVSHTWNEEQKKINFYDVDFGDYIIENIPVGELTILEGVVAEDHGGGGHPAKREPAEEKQIRIEVRKTKLGNIKESQQKINNLFSGRQKMLFDSLKDRYIK